MHVLRPAAAALCLGVLSLACSQAPPEVAINDQVPEDQVQAESTGSEGGGGGGGEVAGTFTAGTALAFDDAPDTLPAGPIMIALELTGALPHNVTFEGINGDEAVAEGTSAGTYTGSVTLQPGEVTYYCSIVGHREGGMEGTLTVEEGAAPAGGEASPGEGEASPAEGGEPSPEGEAAATEGVAAATEA